MTKDNKRKLMSILIKSQPVVLITTGRTGSDFLQSLLDSHSQIMTFNGHLIDYYSFWEETKNMRENDNCMVEDVAYKFVCKKIHHLKSYYDTNERKHMLGDNRDESLIINIDTFVGAICSFMDGIELNSKNFLVAVYAAYSEALGHNLTKKCILFHHMHHTSELIEFIKDFPNTKIISMTRDPRANYYSGISHRMKLNSFMRCDFIYGYLKRIFIDTSILEQYKVPYTSLRLEDLGKEEVINKVSHWIGIDYEDSLKVSTWGGLSWGGDKFSPRFNIEPGFSQDMINNKWSNKLSSVDKFIFNVVLNSRLKHYGYSYKEKTIINMFVVPFIIILPMSLEYRAVFTQVTLRQFIYNFKTNIGGYVRRVLLFYKYYFNELMGKKFNGPLI